MTGPGNKKSYIKCPWCGRQPVPTKRGRLSSHLSPGGVKCVGIGQSLSQVIILNVRS